MFKIISKLKNEKEEKEQGYLKDRVILINRWGINLTGTAIPTRDRTPNLVTDFADFCSKKNAEAKPLNLVHLSISRL